MKGSRASIGGTLDSSRDNFIAKGHRQEGRCGRGKRHLHVEQPPDQARATPSSGPFTALAIKFVARANRNSRTSSVTLTLSLVAHRVVDLAQPCTS